MFEPEFMAISIWSYARFMNLAKVEQNGILPAALIPAPTETMFCSAILHSTNRDSRSASFLNVSEKVEFETSASSTTTSVLIAPSARSATPYALRVANLPDESTCPISIDSIAVLNGGNSASFTFLCGASDGGSMVNSSDPLNALVSSILRSAISPSAFSSASPVAGLPCHPPPCIDGAPQPLIVLATIAIGLVFSFAEISINLSNAALIWFGACPSISMTSNPKA